MRYADMQPLQQYQQYQVGTTDDAPKGASAQAVAGLGEFRTGGSGGGGGSEGGSEGGSGGSSSPREGSGGSAGQRAPMEYTGGAQLTLQVSTRAARALPTCQPSHSFYCSNSQVFGSTCLR